MRWLLPVFLAAVPCAAGAQVSTNDSALQSLRQPAKPAPVRKPLTRPHHAAHPAKHAPKPAQPSRLPAPPISAGPPPPAVIGPPPLVVPTRPAPPPPPVPVKPGAPGEAVTIKGGTRITFGAGVSDLNDTTMAALKSIAAAALADPGERVVLTAYAPGSADDPSTPRRLSLDRALAARAVLINAGMASERIYARAMGTDGIAAGPADRLDITTLPGPGAAAAGPGSAPPEPGASSAGAPAPPAPPVTPGQPK